MAKLAQSQASDSSITFDDERAVFRGEDQPVLQPDVTADNLVGKIGIDASWFPWPGLEGPDRGEGGGCQTPHDGLQFQGLADLHHLDSACFLSPATRRFHDIRERSTVQHALFAEIVG